MKKHKQIEQARARRNEENHHFLKDINNSDTCRSYSCCSWIKLFLIIPPEHNDIVHFNLFSSNLFSIWS